MPEPYCFVYQSASKSSSGVGSCCGGGCDELVGLDSQDHHPFFVDVLLTGCEDETGLVEWDGLDCVRWLSLVDFVTDDLGCFCLVCCVLTCGFFTGAFALCLNFDEDTVDLSVDGVDGLFLALESLCGCT